MITVYLLLHADACNVLTFVKNKYVAVSLQGLKSAVYCTVGIKSSEE